MKKLFLILILITNFNCKVTIYKCTYDVYQGGKIIGTEIWYRGYCTQTRMRSSLFYVLNTIEIINGNV